MPLNPADAPRGARTASLGNWRRPPTRPLGLHRFHEASDRGLRMNMRGGKGVRGVLSLQLTRRCQSYAHVRLFLVERSKIAARPPGFVASRMHRNTCSWCSVGPRRGNRRVVARCPIPSKCACALSKCADQLACPNSWVEATTNGRMFACFTRTVVRPDRARCASANSMAPQVRS